MRAVKAIAIVVGIWLMLLVGWNLLSIFLGVYDNPALDTVANIACLVAAIVLYRRHFRDPVEVPPIRREEIE